MRLVAIALIAGCSGMPDVNGDTLGEPGQAALSVSPGQTTVNALGTELMVTNTGDRASGAIGARLVDHDAARFAITHSECSVLQPGASCAIGVRYAPGTGAETGMTDLEIEEDNEPVTSAELDGKLEPAIRWAETSVPLAGVACSAAGPTEKITRTIHLEFTDVAVGGVQVAATDPHYAILNNTCIGAMSSSGECTVDVQVVRGDTNSALVPAAVIEAKIAGLSAQVTTSYALAHCDLTLAPSPFVLGAANLNRIMLLKNTSTTTSHTIATAMIPDSPIVSVLANMCASGLVLGPGEMCGAKLVYTPTTNPQSDPITLPFVVTTADPEPLALSNDVTVELEDNLIHFDLPDYNWGAVTTGQAAPQTVHVNTDGITMAGPLTITLTSQSWMVENNAGSCGLPFTNECVFKVDFTAPAAPGTYSAMMIARGPSGQIAFATLHAKAQ